MSLKATVLGAGNFGTALASVLLANGHDVTLWCYEDGHAEEVEAAGRNPRYAKDADLTGIRATGSLEAAVTGAELVLFVSPSHATRSIAKSVAPVLGADAIVACASKGIESGGATMNEILEEELGDIQGRVGYLSGPSFAFEIVQRRPTAVVVASRSDDVASRIQEAFSTAFFRVYTTHDVVGVELGGAVKNIMAIASGISDGLEFGHNARAGLITRGLAEMTRLGVALGAEPLTFMGLAGMGDLVLTCCGDLSRNRTVGKRLASGMTLDEVTESLGGQVAEGVKTTASTHKLAKKLGLDMPIVEVVHSILYEGADPRECVVQLMGRPLKRERD